MDEQRLQERVGLYSLLRVLYTYPLQETVLEAVSQLEIAATSPWTAGLSSMQARLHEVGRQVAARERLNVEMTRLLEGPGLTPAPPYASYYLHGGQLMGPAATAVRRFYLSWQALPKGDVRLPDDHIALELGFLAYLAEQAANGVEIEKALRASSDFIRQHLKPWLAHFCAALRDATTEPFFQGLADFTMSAIREDIEWLGEELAEISGEVAFAAPSY